MRAPYGRTPPWREGSRAAASGRSVDHLGNGDAEAFGNTAPLFDIGPIEVTDRPALDRLRNTPQRVHQIDHQAVSLPWAHEPVESACLGCALVPALAIRGPWTTDAGIIARRIELPEAFRIDLVFRTSFPHCTEQPWRPSPRSCAGACRTPCAGCPSAPTRRLRSRRVDSTPRRLTFAQDTQRCAGSGCGVADSSSRGVSSPSPAARVAWLGKFARRRFATRWQRCALGSANSAKL